MSGKAVRETVGFLGVIASMVFVGTERRGRRARLWEKRELIQRRIGLIEDGQRD